MNFMVLFLRITMFVLLATFVIILLVKKPSTVNITIFVIIVIVLIIKYKFNKFLYEFFTNKFLRVLFGVGVACEFIFTMLLIIVVVILIYFNSNNIIDEDVKKRLLLDKLDLIINEGLNSKSILVKEIQKSQSLIYSYAISVYLKEVEAIPDFPEKKYLFFRNDDKNPKTKLATDNTDTATDNTDTATENTNGRNIGLRMGNTKNDLTTLYLDYATETSGVTKFYTTPIYNNFPIKKWTNILVTVDTNVINFFIDGIKLTKQVYIPNLKAPSASTPIEFGNMNAHLANLEHSTIAVTPTPSFIEQLSKVNEIVV